jgi:hypothetical protein
MRALILIFLILCASHGYWQKYKAEKIAAYQAQHGGDVCEVHNVLIGVECRPFTRAELEAKEQDEALQRWNDRVADAEARKRVAQQVEDILVYGK